MLDHRRERFSPMSPGRRLGARSPRRNPVIGLPLRFSPFRLEFCVELTKPDSLTIREMGTPKNHRSPPF